MLPFHYYLPIHQDCFSLEPNIFFYAYLFGRYVPFLMIAKK